MTVSDEADAILTAIAVMVGMLLGAFLEIYIASKERRIRELEDQLEAEMAKARAR